MATSNDTTKTCTKCKREFPATLEYFYPEKRVKCGLMAHCKECQSRMSGATPREKLPKGLKRCSQCKRILPLDADHFHRKASARNGFASECRECAIPKKAEYYREHRAEMLAYFKERYANNPEPIKQYVKEWRLKNLDKVNQRVKAYAQAHPEQIKETKARWKQNNPEKLRESRRLYKRNRLSRIRAIGGKHTQADIEQLYKSQKGLCWWCGNSVGDNYHIDHRIPVSKGGSNDIRNLVVSCPDCNRFKSNKQAWEWSDRLL